MKNRKKLYKIIVVVLNLLLGLGKFLILGASALEAERNFSFMSIRNLTIIQKISLYGRGILIAIILDFLVNYIIVKIINRKKHFISYKKVVICSLIITIVETFLLDYMFYLFEIGLSRNF